MTVIEFPQQNTGGISVHQIRGILLMSRDSMERQLGAFGQEDELRVWAESQGYPVVAMIHETKSGRLPLEQRFDMLTALDMLKNDEIDAIAWTTFCRMARSVKQTRRILHACWDANVRTFVLNGEDNQPYGEVCRKHPERFWLPLAERAEDEGRLIQERMTVGKRRKVLRGAYPLSGCAPPPFEMDRVERKDPYSGEMRKVQIPNRERWELKERMIVMYDSGMTFKGVAEALNAAGIRQRHGVLWTWEAVRSVVRKPFPILHDIVWQSPDAGTESTEYTAEMLSNRARSA